MNTENKQQIKETKDKGSQSSVWKEYSAFHDHFVELLSYDRKHNHTSNNVWTFCYV